MSELLTTGQAAELLNRPPHQVRRTLDSIWPDAPRAGKTRLIRIDQLTELAQALAARYRSEQVAK